MVRSGPEKTREFYMWGQQAEIVIRVKHRNGSTVEVPVSNVSYNVGASFNELRIPLHGRWFDKLVETTDFSSMKRG